MDERFAALPLTNSTSLCVGGITDAEAEAARDDGAEADGFGYYLFLADETAPQRPIEVLAKFLSVSQAEKIRQDYRVKREFRQLDIDSIFKLPVTKEQEHLPYQPNPDVQRGSKALALSSFQLVHMGLEALHLGGRGLDGHTPLARVQGQEGCHVVLVAQFGERAVHGGETV